MHFTNIWHFQSFCCVETTVLKIRWLGIVFLPRETLQDLKNICPCFPVGNLNAELMKYSTYGWVVSSRVRLFVGYRGSGRVNVPPSRVGSKKRDPWTTLLHTVNHRCLRLPVLRELMSVICDSSSRQRSVHHRPCHMHSPHAIKLLRIACTGEMSSYLRFSCFLSKSNMAVHHWKFITGNHHRH